MFTNMCLKLKHSKSFVKQLCTIQSAQENVNAPCKLKFPPKYQKPRQIWIENFDSVNEKRLSLLDLHPEVFGANPRLDIVHQNVRWQQNYRFVSFAHTKVRSEVAGGGKKPWPQKGLGKARHGSIRSPLFKGGGIAHGPRSPNVHFYMLPFYTRVHGLTSMLSIKLAQDDLHVVKDIEIPTEDTKFIEDLMQSRMWGPSVLIVDDYDIMPRNITVATDNIKHVNVMPLYGLNVYSMLKHDTLILTLAAVIKLEEKLLMHLHKNNVMPVQGSFKVDQQ